MLTISNLTFQHDNSDFEIAIPNWNLDSGELCVLTGASGSGKTTLLHLIAGLYLPKAGTITVQGGCTADLSGQQRREMRLATFGLVFQDFRLFSYLTAAENISLPYNLSGSNSAHPEWIETLSEAFGITGILHQRAATLSRGEQQRVAICRALAGSPAFILADEPTASVDSECRDTILNTLRTYCEDHNATMILTSHDPSIRDSFTQSVDIQDLQHSEVLES